MWDSAVGSFCQHHLIDSWVPWNSFITWFIRHLSDICRCRAERCGLPPEKIGKNGWMNQPDILLIISSLTFWKMANKWCYFDFYLCTICLSRPLSKARAENTHIIVPDIYNVFNLSSVMCFRLKSPESPQNIRTVSKIRPNHWATNATTCMLNCCSLDTVQVRFHLSQIH